MIKVSGHKSACGAMLKAGCALIIKVSAAALLSIVLLNAPSFAEYGGNSSENFLRLDPDPESAALGGSIMALGSMPSAMIANPAALAYNFQPKISFTNMSLAGDVRYNFTGIAVPLKYGTVAAGAAFLDFGGIQGYYSDFTAYDLPASGQSSVILNYALPIRSQVPVLKEYGSVGASLKFISGNLAGYTAGTTAFDIGCTYNMPFVARGLNAGMVISNYGSASSYNSSSAKLPSQTRIGLRYDRPEWKDFFAVADGESGADGTGLSAGAGISPVYPLSLRLGWKFSDTSLLAGLNMGFGLSFRNFTLRYAVSALKDISAVHRVGIDITFESFTTPQAAYDHYLKRYFELARDKYEARDYIESRRMFEDILSVYPGHLPSKEYLLKLNAELDRMEQRQQVKVDRWLRKAGVSLERNDIFTARKYYSLALNIDSENIEAMEGMGRIRDLLGDYETEEDIQLNKQRIAKLWENAMTCYNKGDYVVAKEKFQEILRIDPNNEQAARYVSELFNQLNKISSLQTDELYNKGIELFGSGNYAEAKKYFNSVLISDPSRQDAAEYAAACQQKLEEQQRKAAAERDAYRNVRMKNEIESAYFSAMKLYQQGSYEDAIKVFTRTRETALQHDFIKYAESSKHYITASRNALSEQYYRQGYKYFKENKYEAAAESYSLALEYNPEYTSAKTELDRVNDLLAQNYYEEGMKEFSAGNNDKAKALFKKSLEYKFDKTESIRALERMK